MSIGDEFIAKIDELHRAGKFFGFTIWPTNGGYQVNLATSAPNNWRIRRGETPSEGVAMVLGMDFMDDDGQIPRMLAPPDVDEPPHDEAHEYDATAIEIEDAEAAGIFD